MINKYKSNHFLSLVYDVLPASVANTIKAGGKVPPGDFPDSSILFTGVVGFNEYSNRHSGGSGAGIIVEMLNILFTAFDNVIEDKRLGHEGKVYKVETVLDHYLAVSGLPEKCIDHARSVTRLGKGWRWRRTRFSSTIPRSSRSPRQMHNRAHT